MFGQCNTDCQTAQQSNKLDQHQPKSRQNSSLPATLLDLASRASASSVERCARGHVTARHNHTLGPALKWAMLSPSLSTNAEIPKPHPMSSHSIWKRTDDGGIRWKVERKETLRKVSKGRRESGKRDRGPCALLTLSLCAGMHLVPKWKSVGLPKTALCSQKVWDGKN